MSDELFKDLTRTVGRLIRDRRQQDVADWVTSVFGAEVLAQEDERGARLLEEAVELAQALGVTRATADKIVARVFQNEPGHPWGEIAHVGITLLACAAAVSVSADEVEHNEIVRLRQIPPEKWRASHEAKRSSGITLDAAAGTKPGAAPPISSLSSYSRGACEDGYFVRLVLTDVTEFRQWLHWLKQGFSPWAT
jgi:hypothetical protein